MQNDVPGVRADWIKRVRLILSRLDAAIAPEAMDAPGLNFHPLTGDRKGTYSVLVSRNWRITFQWKDKTRRTSIWRVTMARKTLRHPDLQPSHPGAFLGEIVIRASGLSKTAIAEMLRVSRQTLYTIINGDQPVTPNMAVRLGKLFGDGPEVWLNMQQAYDLWRAQREVDVTGIPTIKAA